MAACRAVGHVETTALDGHGFAHGPVHLRCAR